jgi:hypothetical protein
MRLRMPKNNDILGLLRSQISALEKQNKKLTAHVDYLTDQIRDLKSGKADRKTLPPGPQYITEKTYFVAAHDQPGFFIAINKTGSIRFHNSVFSATPNSREPIVGEAVVADFAADGRLISVRNLNIGTFSSKDIDKICASVSLLSGFTKDS